MIKNEFNFWKHVNIRGEDDCWEWRGSHNRYGDITFKKQHLSAHRLAYILTYGKNIKNKYVLHICDNPLCVNPKHLWLGTQQDNIKDMVEKKRGLVGELNGNNKLTKEQILEIRELYTTGKYLQRELAKMFYVHQVHISEIITRKQWKHI